MIVKEMTETSCCRERKMRLEGSDTEREKKKDGSSAQYAEIVE